MDANLGPPFSDPEISDGETTWRFDRTFLTSNWTCIWGRGCLGILPQPAPHLGQGCCSMGADLDGDDEARRIAALAATLQPARFEHHGAASECGVFADSSCRSTRVVDGACIFLNRPGFAGGAGCALHLAALDSGESPIDWKPSVCWQLPIKVDWEPGDDGTEVATVRGWTRSDWGTEGATMAWAAPRAPWPMPATGRWSTPWPRNWRPSSAPRCSSNSGAASAARRGLHDHDGSEHLAPLHPLEGGLDVAETDRLRHEAVEVEATP
jgi:hypothetical protein